MEVLTVAVRFTVIVFVKVDVVVCAVTIHEQLALITSSLKLDK